MHIYIDRVEKSRTARSDKNTNSCCRKAFNKTVARNIFYHKSKILQTNKKTRKKKSFQWYS